MRRHKDQTRVPPLGTPGTDQSVSGVKGQRSRAGEGGGVKTMFPESQQCLVLVYVFILSNDWKL